MLFLEVRVSRIPKFYRPHREAQGASWRPTLAQLLAHGQPWVFSSYAPVEVGAACGLLWEEHGVRPERVRTELNPFSMPLDEGWRVARGAIDFPWVSNALLSFVGPGPVELN